MGFNYAAARKALDKQWESLRVEYEKAGMPQESIHKMYRFDLDVLNSNRRYVNHIQTPLCSDKDCTEVDDGQSVLLCKLFDGLAVYDDDSNEHSRYWWVEEINNPVLAKKIKELSIDDLELLTLIIMDGFRQAEIAKMLDQIQSTISRKITRIKKLLTNFDLCA